jgi:lipoprotein-anchoring transpeptidase ErfK/SrfK
MVLHGSKLRQLCLGVIGGLLLAGGVTPFVGNQPAQGQPTAQGARLGSISSLLTVPGNIIPGIEPQADSPIAPTQSAVAPTTQPIHLVLKLNARRVYVYQGDAVVSSYPVAIGKAGWETPVGSFTVMNMEKNPTFKNFKTGHIIPPGPDNPLGTRWIGIWTDGKSQLGFHGTNQPELIGKAVSHGCIRMHNQDVSKLYTQVQIGTTVEIVP